MTQQATQQGSQKHKNNGSVKPFYIAAWLFPKNCGSAAILTSALSHQTVWLQERCGNPKWPKKPKFCIFAV